ncbi:hypothetical protein [Microbispora sp. NPDC049125]|uniref:Acg family FMN-binding oxidoreductase n=1 Tax=Microbispora sp. NPDC049125 TaxID=3154929 RepID=UPI003465FE08
MTNRLQSVVQAAVWAPSLHNTQPWSFVIEDEEIRLRADTGRRLRVSDPRGRELMLSCGAALFNMRIALRALGREAVVRVLPDPDRPVVLATVREGEPCEPDERTRLLHAEIVRRRTHRAGFAHLPIPGPLLDALVRQAEQEGARLTFVGSEPVVRVLAALTAAAEEVQEQDRALSLELARWSRPPGTRHSDGVAPHAYPSAPRRTYPHFSQRDYAHGHAWGSHDDQRAATSTGRVALLTTPGDEPGDWIVAGQALQRALLYASAHGVGAAFHTQALEHGHLRAFIRQEVCSGEHPQMIMRLGYPLTEAAAVRRPISEVLDRR